MAIEPVKIPQNVYIEDRIVGPLTLRQVITVAIGGGFSYALWASISKAYGAVSIPITVLVWLPGLLSILFAFVKFNDLSMLQICLLMIERMNKPTTRTFAPRKGITINIKTFAAAADQTLAKVQLPQKQPAQLEELSAALDNPIDRMPMDDDTENALWNQEVDEKSPSRKPVDPSRVKASPLPNDAKATSAIFQDIVPRPPLS